MYNYNKYVFNKSLNDIPTGLDLSPANVHAHICTVALRHWLFKLMNDTSSGDYLGSSHMYRVQYAIVSLCVCMYAKYATGEYTWYRWTGRFSAILLEKERRIGWAGGQGFFHYKKASWSFFLSFLQDTRNRVSEREQGSYGVCSGAHNPRIAP